MLTAFFPVLFSASATLISIFFRRFVPFSTICKVWSRESHYSIHPTTVSFWYFQCKKTVQGTWDLDIKKSWVCTCRYFYKHSHILLEDNGVYALWSYEKCWREQFSLRCWHVSCWNRKFGQSFLKQSQWLATFYCYPKSKVFTSLGEITRFYSLTILNIFHAYSIA